MTTVSLDYATWKRLIALACAALDHREQLADNGMPDAPNETELAADADAIQSLATQVESP